MNAVTQSRSALRRFGNRVADRLRHPSSTTGEPGGVVAHVGPATPSHKTNAAGRPGPAAFTPTDSDSTREVPT